MANTLIPYFVLWGLMIWSIQYSYWITLGLSVFASGFLMRTFIIFHDCGHGSFFKSRKANDWVGRITGFLNFTPYYRWKHDHAIHHATAGDLDRRGTGDVYTMTVKEYLAAPWWMKIGYRIMRNPFFLFGVAPLAVFLLTQRIPAASQGKRERASVLWTDFFLVLVIALMCWLIGWKTFLMIQLPIIWISSTIGRTRFWEVLGTLRWGVICTMSGIALRSGGPWAIERPMIARRASETELDLLNLLREDN